jgi:hypothetical protein
MVQTRYMKHHARKKPGLRFVAVIIGVLFILSGILITIISKKTEESPVKPVLLPLFSVATPKTNVAVGDEFDVALTVTPKNMSIGAAYVVLTFDPEAVKLMGMTPGSDFVTILEPEKVLYGEHRAKLAIATGSSNLTTGTALFAAYRFRALRPRASTTIGISKQSFVQSSTNQKEAEYLGKDKSDINIHIE